MVMEINADNLRMVNGQIKPINGMTEKLVSIFYSLNREDFMPEEFKESAYIEKNLALSNHSWTKIGKEFHELSFHCLNIVSFFKCCKVPDI